MVTRVYVEKRPGLDVEATGLLADLRTLLNLEGLTGLRLLNRYDVEGLDDALFAACRNAIFSEPQVDLTWDELPQSDVAFAIEYQPGQFDQRADSAAQCIQLLAQCDRPAVRCAKVYLLTGSLTEEEVSRIKSYLINPVESREAQLEPYETLAENYPTPEKVAVLAGFRKISDKAAFIAEYGLAMDEADLAVCIDYFKKEGRDPTLTELRMIDTYWSDHCRHTTFGTVIDEVIFEDKLLQSAFNEYLAERERLGVKKPVCLMDLATISVRSLKPQGQPDKLAQSAQCNAFTVVITVETESGSEPWLLLFKNETHNHPTEIEPFGGAATCVGGAIRDPLSGRAYVYAAMRLTGAADPTRPISETLPGKLPQRKIVADATAGYSSYGNQIGLTTGIVDEVYHPGYEAKRMEVGAVIGAAPAENVRRETPISGDAVILLGGRTGRDGCGGATGSSKSHTTESLATCGAEVQKGNAPEERKLQRLFRNPKASRLIKRCNDFGAGGVSVAIGELADGLDIDLSLVPRKYAGLDGTELAISESQERMAVVVAENDVPLFLELAAAENLEATVVAHVKEEKRVTMTWNGDVIVDLSREFLSCNGAPKHITAAPAAPQPFAKPVPASLTEGLRALADDLNVCSKQGMAERFDCNIGAGTVLMPYGGRFQRTPIQAMAHKISREKGEVKTASLMSWGFNPHISDKSPYHGAYLAVVESAAKLAATGADLNDTYLSFQEYFEKLGSDPVRWGKPLAALLGAYRAQKALSLASIGGKDSMSGSFEEIHVPPTLISFAVSVQPVKEVASPEFKAAGHKVVLLAPETDTEGLPTGESLKKAFGLVTDLLHSGRALAAWTPGFGGVAEGLMKMGFGNGIGVALEETVTNETLFSYAYGSFILELAGDETVGLPLGVTTADGAISRGKERISLDELLAVSEAKLAPIFPRRPKEDKTPVPTFSFEAKERRAPAVLTRSPHFLIPVFPGTNCEYDTARAVEKAGGESEIFVIRNLTAADITESIGAFAAAIRRSNAIIIPGGFSGGDEPDGSGKFITAFFRNARVKDAVTELLEQRDGLMCGICNGFQALVKMGLVPFGKIMDMDESCPTLFLNTIGRLQSRVVRTRVASNMSPWMSETKVGEIYYTPIAHGEGRFLADAATLDRLAKNGQIALQYVDSDGNPTMDIDHNPNGSTAAIESITSPDGRVLGKMAHVERTGNGLLTNVPGNYDMGLFRSAVRYFGGK